MHAFIYDNGFSVTVELEDGKTAGFGHLAFPGEAWDEARKWATKNGAKTVEYREPWPEKAEEMRQKRLQAT